MIVPFILKSVLLSSLKKQFFTIISFQKKVSRISENSWSSQRNLKIQDENENESENQSVNEGQGQNEKRKESFSSRNELNPDLLSFPTYSSTSFSSMAQECSEQSLPLSSTLLAQHQKNQKQLNYVRNVKYNNRFQYGCSDVDASSVSSCGGENIHKSETLSPPKSPVLTPVCSSHKRGGGGGGEGVSNRLIHDAFSSLSLADKCALSVSLCSNNNSTGNCNNSMGGSNTLIGQGNSNGTGSGTSAGAGIVRKLSSSSYGSGDSITSTYSPVCVIAALEDQDEEDSERLFGIDKDFSHSISQFQFYSHSSSSSVGEEYSANNDSYLSPRLNYLRSHGLSGNIGERGERGSGGECSGNGYESMSIRSVISESDKESLDVVMSMMGQQELDQVEDEVRKIQNNVRGWLLRKNYVNLRDAAKTLQVAWRGKKRMMKNHRSVSDSGEGKDLNYSIKLNKEEGESRMELEFNSNDSSIINEEDENENENEGNPYVSSNVSSKALSMSSSSSSSDSSLDRMVLSESANPMKSEYCAENVPLNGTNLIIGTIDRVTERLIERGSGSDSVGANDVSDVARKILQPDRSLQSSTPIATATATTIATAAGAAAFGSASVPIPSPVLVLVPPDSMSILSTKRTSVNSSSDIVNANMNDSTVGVDVSTGAPLSYLHANAQPVTETSAQSSPQTHMKENGTHQKNMKFHSKEELHAAGTLQAATRAMIARRNSFSQAKKQAMASLIIQKSFLHWFHKDQSTAVKNGETIGRKRKVFR